jgi:AAA family ATP:ADP antiporter
MTRPRLERLLSPIADVRREEVASALLMTLLVFLLLAAYYLLKTAREVFILTEGGAEVKSYSSAGQALLLLVLVPAYGACASRAHPVRLVTGVTLFFASNLVLFAAAVAAGLRVGVVYFLWVGIFNLMVVAQFWAFASDLYSSEQGKRLFPLIGVGASLGAWLGSVRAGTLMSGSGPGRLLAGACVILVVCAALVPLVARITARARAGPAAPRPVLSREGGFALIRGDRYLALLAALMLLLNVVNSTGEYLFGRYVEQQSLALHGGEDPGQREARERFVGETYSRLFSTVNLAGFLLQAFVVARIFKWFGVGTALVIHPAVALAGYLLMTRAPSLPFIAGVKIADNSLDYSLGNTARQALWLPASREAKYKAKQAIDALFVRGGDVASAALVFAGERLAFSITTFAALNALVACAWLLVAGLLAARHAQMALAPRAAS